MRDPYDIEASQDLFLQAVRENCAYHYAHCGEYRAILEHFHFSPETLRCETDLARLPALPTAFLKDVRFIPCRVGASWSGQRHPAQKDR